MGFEPTVRCRITGFQDQLLHALDHSRQHKRIRPDLVRRPPPLHQTHRLRHRNRIHPHDRRTLPRRRQILMERRHVLRLRDAEPVKKYIFSDANGERPTPSNAGRSPRTPANHPKSPKKQKKRNRPLKKMICPAFLLFIFPQKISQSPFAPTSPAHTPHSHSHTSHPASSGSYTSLHSPDPDNKTYCTT